MVMMRVVSDAKRRLFAHRLVAGTGGHNARRVHEWRSLCSTSTFYCLFCRRGDRNESFTVYSLLLLLIVVLNLR